MWIDSSSSMDTTNSITVQATCCASDTIAHYKVTPPNQQPYIPFDSPPSLTVRPSIKVKKHAQRGRATAIMCRR